MKNLILIFFVTILFNSCILNRIGKTEPGAIRLSNIDVFDLPSLSEDHALAYENYYFNINKKDSLILSMQLFFKKKQKKPFTFHSFSKDNLYGYSSDPYIFHHCEYVDSFLIHDNKIYFSKQCEKYKTNMIFEKEGDTVKVTEFLYDENVYPHDIARKAEWEKGTSEIRRYYLIQRQNIIEYNCYTADSIFCPVSFNNLFSIERPPSFFWHFLYIAHFSRY